MELIAGYARTGRQLLGSGSDLVEVGAKDGSRLTAILFHPEYRGHNAINAALNVVIGFLESPMVSGLAELAVHDRDVAGFVYPTGPVWSIAEVIRTLSDMGECAGVRAGVELMYQAGTVLVEAAEAGEAQGVYSHGGLTPWRVMLDVQGNLQIVGYALPQVEILVFHESPDRIPREDAFRYCPPERMEAKKENFTSDLFGLALIAFELMTGRPVYDGLINDIRTKAARGETSRRIQQFREQMPPAVQTLLTTAMRPEFRDRFQSGAEFLDAVSEAMASPACQGASLRDVMAKVTRHQPRARQELDPASTAAMSREDLIRLAQEDRDQPVKKALRESVSLPTPAAKPAAKVSLPSRPPPASRPPPEVPAALPPPPEPTPTQAGARSADRGARPSAGPVTRARPEAPVAAAESLAAPMQAAPAAATTAATTPAATPPAPPAAPTPAAPTAAPTAAAPAPAAATAPAENTVASPAPGPSAVPMGARRPPRLAGTRTSGDTPPVTPTPAAEAAPAPLPPPVAEAAPPAPAPPPVAEAAPPTAEVERKGEAPASRGAVPMGAGRLPPSRRPAAEPARTSEPSIAPPRASEGRDLPPSAAASIVNAILSSSSEGGRTARERIEQAMRASGDSESTGTDLRNPTAPPAPTPAAKLPPPPPAAPPAPTPAAKLPPPPPVAADEPVVPAPTPVVVPYPTQAPRTSLPPPPPPPVEIDENEADGDDDTNPGLDIGLPPPRVEDRAVPKPSAPPTPFTPPPILAPRASSPASLPPTPMSSHRGGGISPAQAIVRPDAAVPNSTPPPVVTPPPPVVKPAPVAAPPPPPVVTPPPVAKPAPVAASPVTPPPPPVSTPPPPAVALPPQPAVKPAAAAAPPVATPPPPAVAPMPAASNRTYDPLPSALRPPEPIRSRSRGELVAARLARAPGLRGSRRRLPSETTLAEAAHQLIGQVVPLRTSPDGRVLGWYRIGNDLGPLPVDMNYGELDDEENYTFHFIPNETPLLRVSIDGSPPVRIQVATALPVASLLDALAVQYDLPDAIWQLVLDDVVLDPFHILADHSLSPQSALVVRRVS